jgi:hypothetical protein
MVTEMVSKVRTGEDIQATRVTELSTLTDKVAVNLTEAKEEDKCNNSKANLNNHAEVADFLEVLEIKEITEDKAGGLHHNNLVAEALALHVAAAVPVVVEVLAAAEEAVVDTDSLTRIFENIFLEKPHPSRCGFSIIIFPCGNQKLNMLPEREMQAKLMSNFSTKRWISKMYRKFR